MSRFKLTRVPFLAAALVALGSGVWGGLVRLQWPLPLPGNDASWISHHGPLLITGFLGTVISLERAVASGSGWAYLAPLLSAGAGLCLVLGGQPPLAHGLAAAGAAALAGVSGLLASRQPSWHGAVVVAGAVSLLVGNVLWAADWRIPDLVFWWAGFLVLTIAGERLELSRFRRPRRLERPLLVLGLSVLVLGLLATLTGAPAGQRVVGLGLASLAVWLATHDIARRALGEKGLPGFMGVALYSGYVWLLAAGVLVLALPPVAHAPAYDAALHAVFLGFAVSMVLGHAPIVFPAVLGIDVPFRLEMYAPLLLLQGAVALRFCGDLAVWDAGKRWGGLLGAVAILLFLVLTAGSALRARRP